MSGGPGVGIEAPAVNGFMWFMFSSNVAGATDTYQIVTETGMWSQL